MTRLVSRLLLLLGILAALLFLPAGRWDWPQAWVFLLSLGVVFLLYALWGTYKDPEQLRERSRIARNVKRWDKIILAVYTALLPPVFILAGFDAGRFRWSKVPFGVQVSAWAGLLVCVALIFWTVTTNTYLSRLARIQEERGQVVVTSGPYRYIRHPMYLGILIFFLCLGPALGSWYTLIPGLAIDVLFVVRTAKEDEMLREELVGYEDYARRVSYRLIPGVW
ncbi:MAG: isoprenylcysteine carboxylmethyltransferase family protein [Candidatus Eisenbacteria bacterium]|nr:isoprenylcysteine carboxylmethyltransferase family protein [Candidatus Eisenbacteria bacterium]